MPAKPARWLIILAFLAVYLIWGSSYIGIRFAIETLPPFLMAAVRFLIAGGLLFGWNLLRRTPLPTRANWRAAFIAGGLLFLINNSMLAWAQDHGLPSGIASVVLSTVPIWVVMMNWLILRNPRPNISVFLGSALGLFGIILLVNPTNVDSTLDPFLVLVILGAAAAWAAGSLYARQADLPQNASLSTGMQLITGGSQLLLLSIITGDAARLDVAQISLSSVLAVLHLLLFSSIVAFSAYVWLIRVVPPERAATYAYVNPVIAVFLGWLLAGETLEPITLVAAAIIILAVFLIISNPFGKGRIFGRRHIETIPPALIEQEA